MEFISENILLIVTIGAFIVFAIIGFVVDNTKNGKRSKKEKEILTEEIKPNEENKKDNEVSLDSLTKK